MDEEPVQMMSHSDADLSYTPPLMAPKMKDMDTEEELMETFFKRNDPEGNGFISVALLCSLGKGLLSKKHVGMEVDEMIRVALRSTGCSNGQVGYEQFVKFMGDILDENG